MKEKVSSDNAPKAEGLLSQGITSNGFIFTAGQIHSLPDGTLINGSVEEKTHQAIKNVQAILEAAGSTLENTVKVTIYVTDMSFGPKINEVYKTYFIQEPLPAREMVCVKELPLGADIEMSVIAIKTSV